MSRNPFADRLLAFIDASPSPFHAVAAALRDLRDADPGIRLLSEAEDWDLGPGLTYALTRNHGTLLAFRLPEQFDPAALRFRIIGAHTDSPCLKLKPQGTDSPGNYRQWGVEVYGGVLQNSWLDRDLFLSGRVTHITSTGIRSALLSFKEARFRIPQLAIHLDRSVNEQGLILNAQRHLVPVLGLKTAPGMGAWPDFGIYLVQKASEAFAQSENLLPPSPSFASPAHPLSSGFGSESALNAGSGHSGSPAGKVEDPLRLEDLSFDLFFHDAVPTAYGGLNDEFLYAPRLDNLAMSHAALEAFCRAKSAPHVIPVLVLFDNEEVGSTSAPGAQGDLLQRALPRLLEGLAASPSYDAVKARSVFLSGDMAHALHPNYPERHEPNHLPLLGQGPVIKGNASQRYATSGEGAAFFRLLCRRAGVPFQNFVNRSDMGCGTTIGPLVAAGLGMAAVDVGNPMLSMHSIREMAGAEDHGLMIRVMEEFYRS